MVATVTRSFGVRQQKIHLKFAIVDYPSNYASQKQTRKFRFTLSEDGRSIKFGENCLNNAQ